MSGSLLECNVWLRDPRRREAAMRLSAASSSAIEGIFRPFRNMDADTVKRPSRKRAKSSQSPG
jgi:hypothetical protein